MLLSVGVARPKSAPQRSQTAFSFRSRQRGASGTAFVADYAIFLVIFFYDFLESGKTFSNN